MEIFSAKNLSLANHLIKNGCKVIKIRKNPLFKSMVLIDFMYNDILTNSLEDWRKIKGHERMIKE